jgi:hypothetical protein
MATPQYCSIIIAKGGPSGPRRIFRGYCSDAAGSITFPDGGSSITFGFDAYLCDIIWAATLATTPTINVNIGGLPYTILNTATSTAATISRPLAQAPIRIPAGASLNLVQA